MPRKPQAPNAAPYWLSQRARTIYADAFDRMPSGGPLELLAIYAETVADYARQLERLRKRALKVADRREARGNLERASKRVESISKSLGLLPGPRAAAAAQGKIDPKQAALARLDALRAGIDGSSTVQ